MRTAIVILAAAALAGPAQAQFFARKPPPPPPTMPGEDIWPFPQPDPQSWWDEPRPKPSEAADPLGGRRLPRGKRLAAIDNGVDASTYRLWGLMPLQWQVMRGNEMILEVWVRPSRNVRQAIVRITVRDDGRAFVQGRAGYACCEAGVSRRVGFDAELPAGAAQAFLALRDIPIWASPREVQAVRNASTTETVCVSGVGYDLTLLTADRARSLHRECDDVAVGQVADVLEPALKAALGQEPRFDVMFHNRIDFALDRQAYQEFATGGGILKPSPHSRSRAPGAEPEPEPEPLTQP
ncbi:MAG TPA: hypothetical protein VJS38_17550 [Phenylobacterium sp.]|uniref:hypothetical protein n=1 Tax=Phenylobacterium sp. TaxID=1871053 RepID=UPI002B47D535|nr:hypothetical protein [Phenylobacterium sp.]HKR89976.1 hypothetical protein [Phenylobacterium sp.]